MRVPPKCGHDVGDHADELILAKSNRTISPRQTLRSVICYILGLSSLSAGSIPDVSKPESQNGHVLKLITILVRRKIEEC